MIIVKADNDHKYPAKTRLNEMWGSERAAVAVSFGKEEKGLLTLRIKIGKCHIYTYKSMGKNLRNKNKNKNKSNAKALKRAHKNQFRISFKK